MTSIELLHDAPTGQKAVARLLLAHGAGAPMTSPFMNDISGLLTAAGLHVFRFEFPYMAQRRSDGKRRPPPKAESLMDYFAAIVDSVHAQAAGRDCPLLIGGKSMGGRIATLVADDFFNRRLASAAVCLGYPFHPPKKPENPRVAHLVSLQAPLLIIQGERDPFGSRAEVEGYRLSKNTTVIWAKDGDHDLGPRGGQGTTRRENIEAAAAAIAAFASTQAAFSGR